MTGHYCKDHKTLFFMKGKMKNYAHPIKGEAGNDTGEWCNETEETRGEAPHAEPTPEMTKKDWDKKDKLKDESIKAQVSFKEGMELYRTFLTINHEYKPDPKTQIGKYIIHCIEAGKKWIGDPLVEEIKESE